MNEFNNDGYIPENTIGKRIMKGITIGAVGLLIFGIYLLAQSS